MAEKRPWTEEEDRLLKFVFDASKLTKWSQIARRLQEEFGVKGRNGKQCKERYTTHIDTSHPKEDWGYEEQQTMFELHNQLGNKWAVIGSKLGGKSDNCVKNHFYSLLRKALRKINKVIQEEYKREIKEIKPNILYRIVEVSEQRFKLSATFEKEFVCFSNQLKNELLEFSYDEDDDESSPIEHDIAKKMIEKIGEFNINYKKKTKRERRGSAQEQDLLTPDRYNKVRGTHSENNEDSEQSSSYVNSEDLGNIDNISEDEINHSTQINPNPNVNLNINTTHNSHNSSSSNKRQRRNSADTAENVLQIPGRIRTRANSSEKIKYSPQNVMKDEKDEVEEKEMENQNELEVEQILGGLQILEEDDLPPHPLLMKKETSKYSRYSEGVVDREEYHFFEQSQIEMRILPEMTMGFHKDSQIDESIFH